MSIDIPAEILSLGFGVLIGLSLMKFYLRFKKNPVVIGMERFCSECIIVYHNLIKVYGGRVRPWDLYCLATLILVQAVSYLSLGFVGAIQPKLLSLLSSINEDGQQVIHIDEVLTLINETSTRLIDDLYGRDKRLSNQLKTLLTDSIQYLKRG